MMTRDKAENLLGKVEDRQLAIGECARWLKCHSEEVEDARFDVLSRYDEKFALDNKDACDFWSHIRDAADSLYLAAEALERLGGREQEKWTRLYGYLERCNGNA